MTGVRDRDVRKSTAETEPEFKSGITTPKSSAQPPITDANLKLGEIEILEPFESEPKNSCVTISANAIISGE